ncbi:MAG: hypothetical protein IPH35_07760 [Rhodoferax sp.]|nr:hypothetical protein [Rhodoferax sp.]
MICWHLSTKEGAYSPKKLRWPNNRREKGRSHDGLEVDLLIAIGGKLQAVEIKLTASPGVGHLAPLTRLLNTLGSEAWEQGLIVCRSESARALPGGHQALPWHQFAT